MRITALLALAALTSSAFAYPLDGTVTDEPGGLEEKIAKPKDGSKDSPLKPKAKKEKLKPGEFPKECDIPKEFDWTKKFELKKNCKLPVGFEFPLFPKLVKHTVGEPPNTHVVETPFEKRFKWPKVCKDSIEKDADWSKGVTLIKECDLPKDFKILKAKHPVVYESVLKKEKEKEEKEEKEKKEKKEKEEKEKKEKEKEKPKPSTDKPAKPITDKPAKPVTEKPVKPVTEKPAKPVTEKPAKPITTKPEKAKPVGTKPEKAKPDDSKPAPVTGTVPGDETTNNGGGED